MYTETTCNLAKVGYLKNKFKAALDHRFAEIYLQLMLVLHTCLVSRAKNR